VAATLSLAAEHARSSPAAALGTLLVHPASQRPSDGGTAGTAAGDAVTPAKGTTTTVAPALGSRADLQ
jgi:hypothetical protein